MIEIIEITKNEDFFNLRNRWNKLLSQSGSNTIFLTWEWLYTWWEVFSDGRRLFILLAKENEEIIGIAPLLWRKVYYYTIFPFKRLEFLSTGENETDETCAVYLNFIISKGKEKVVVDAFLNHLMTKRVQWDEIILMDMAMRNNDLLLNREFDSHIKFKTYGDSKCAYLNLPNSWDDYLNNLGKQKRKNIRTLRKRLGEKVKVEPVVINFGEKSDKNLFSALKPMKDIHQVEWASRNKPGVFASKKFDKFIDSISVRMEKRGWLKLYYLKLDDEEKAFRFTFHYGNKIYAYITGFSPIDDKRIGVGTALFTYCIENAIESGIGEWDLLKSGENSWKSYWATDHRELASIRISKKNLKERSYSALVFIFNIGKRLKKKVLTKGHAAVKTKC